MAEIVSQLKLAFPNLECRELAKLDGEANGGAVFYLSCPQENRTMTEFGVADIRTNLADVINGAGW
jgi:hypothetical protein